MYNKEADGLANEVLNKFASVLRWHLGRERFMNYPLRFNFMLYSDGAHRSSTGRASAAYVIRVWWFTSPTGWLSQWILDVGELMPLGTTAFNVELHACQIGIAKLLELLT